MAGVEQNGLCRALLHDLSFVDNSHLIADFPDNCQIVRDEEEPGCTSG